MQKGTIYKVTKLQALSRGFLTRKKLLVSLPGYSYIKIKQALPYDTEDIIDLAPSKVITKAKSQQYIRRNSKVFRFSKISTKALSVQRTSKQVNPIYPSLPRRRKSNFNSPVPEKSATFNKTRYSTLKKRFLQMNKADIQRQKGYSSDRNSPYKGQFDRKILNTFFGINIIDKSKKK